MSSDYRIAGTADRAEEGDLGESEKLDIAEGDKDGRSLVTQALKQSGRIIRSSSLETVK